MQKKNPKKFYIIGTVNIDQYWSENGNDNATYSLLWKCNKSELDHYIEHFKGRYSSTWDGKEQVEKKQEQVKEPDKISEPIETAVKKEPEMETAIKAPLTHKNKPGRKKS